MSYFHRQPEPKNGLRFSSTDAVNNDKTINLNEGGQTSLISPLFN